MLAAKSESTANSVAPWALSFALVLFLVATRSRFVADQLHHFAPWLRAPDATLAVFFLAGLWIRSLPFAVLLLAASALADQIAFANGVSDWCVTAAYACLIPAYMSMWAAGYFCRGLDLLSLDGLAKFAVALVAASWIEFVVSSGSFFLFSGYFPNMTIVEYFDKTVHYFPSYLGWAVAYIVAGIAIVSMVAPLRNQVAQKNA